MNLHIVTVATQSEFYFPYLVESCKKHGKKLEVLGFGEKWKGYNWKFKLMIDYLKKLSENDIVCFVDGYDVICVRNLNELVPEFLKIKEDTNCSVVIGHDKRYTIAHYPSLLFFGSCVGQDLNSGTYIGYVKDLLLILTDSYNIDPLNNRDDQFLITQYCKKYPSKFHVDETSKLFLALGYPFQELDYYVKINKYVEYNGERPFFIHGAGGGYLNNILTKLDYNCDPYIKTEIILYGMKKAVGHIYSLKYFWILFLFLILILILILILYGRM